MAKNLTNIATLIIIGALFSLFIFSIIALGNDVASNTNANLNNNSYIYILELNGANVSNFENSIGNNSNLAIEATGGTNKDFAIEFFDSQSKYEQLKVYTNAVFHIPSFTINKLLRLELNDYSIIINMFDVLAWVFIFIAGYYLIRRVVT